MTAQATTTKTDRRADISHALYECIRTRGYANTTLADIAAAAGMSPSHVGYYFDNQAAILEHYATALCSQILAGLPALDDPDPQRLAESIADFCFGARQQNTTLLGVIQETTGLAVHDDRLHQIKSDHSAAWRTYLDSYFERTPPALGLTAKQAARMVHATLIGLGTNILFDPDTTRLAAHEAFLQMLRVASGFEPPAGNGELQGDP